MEGYGGHETGRGYFLSPLPFLSRLSFGQNYVLIEECKKRDEDIVKP
jgi:hypothetical protein